MIWKFLGLQKKFDALFDDGWVILGISPLTGTVAHNVGVLRTQS